MPEEAGYPTVVLAAVAVVGVLLLIIRPRLLVPLIWVAILTVDNKAYTFTRIGSGFFLFNLYDLLIVLGLLGALRVSGQADRLRLLKMPVALCVLLGVAVLLTLFQRDLLYEDLRLLRFALIFPLAWAIGALGSNDPASTPRTFLWILVGAVAVQSLRQCVYVIEFADPTMAEGSWRTLRFLNAGLAYVPLSLLLAGDRVSGWRKFALVATTAVAVLALVLTQTRSLWVPQVLVIGALFIWLVPRGRLAVSLLLVGLATAAVAGGGRLFVHLTEGRVDPWAVFFEGRAIDFSDSTGREEAIAADLSAWLDGNWLWGRGLGFHNQPDFDEGLAWGHNGYTSYLANLGILGFVAYGLLVPLSIARSARSLIGSLSPVDRSLGVLALTTVGFCSLESALSSGLLAGHVFSMYAIMGGIVSARAPQGEPTPHSRRLGRRAASAGRAVTPFERGRDPGPKPWR